MTVAAMQALLILLPLKCCDVLHHCLTLHNVCSVHRGDIMRTPGGYHDKCGDRSEGKQLNLYGKPSILDIPQCAYDIPQHSSSWHHSGVLNTPRCTHDILVTPGNPQHCILMIVKRSIHSTLFVRGFAYIGSYCSGKHSIRKLQKRKSSLWSAFTGS